MKFAKAAYKSERAQFSELCTDRASSDVPLVRREQLSRSRSTGHADPRRDFQ